MEARFQGACSWIRRFGAKGVSAWFDYVSVRLMDHYAEGALRARSLLSLRSSAKY